MIKNLIKNLLKWLANITQKVDGFLTGIQECKSEATAVGFKCTNLKVIAFMVMDLARN